MPKLKERVYAVSPGEVYPQWFEAGEECPAWLEVIAEELGALASRKAHKNAPEKK